jgi:anaerobic selenocysteine-containing dehydrogenase
LTVGPCVPDSTSMTETTIRTTCPRDCYDACGVLVTLTDGSIKNVRGDADHPISRGKLCRKCTIGYNGAFLDPDQRLTAPLRRVGPKGSGRFEPISWDAAIAEISERLSGVVRDHGPAAILNAHYTGTCSLLAGHFPMRFFNRLGATEVDPDSVCNKAGQVALDYVFGSAVTGFDPRTVADSRCILVWGANPSASGPHQHEHWLGEADADVIVVDPLRTDTAAAATLHLQPFPGTDAALAFAMVHVLRRDGLVDEGFVAAHTVGYDQIEPLVADCTPQWGERVTGVPAELIIRAAHLYGAGPSLLWVGQGLQRQPTGGNVVRACVLLPAVTGNVGKPGAGFLYLNDHLEIDFEYLVAPHLGEPPEPVSHMDLAGRLEQADRSRALICWNINIAASNPDQARLHAALARDDLFTVVLDLFATDTTDHADIVLPAASFLEFDDLMASYFDLTLSAQVKASEPLGEALPNTEIFRRLAAAMGYPEPELSESDHSMIAALLDQAGVVASFDELARVGTVPLTADPVMQFEGLEFPTPSGRIEIASAAAEADGHPRVPQPWADARPAGDRMRLLTPASQWMLNDTFTNDPKITKRLGPAEIALNPADAARRGLIDGAQVMVANDVGSLLLQLRLSEDVPVGVALSPKGRWPKREAERANVNVLNPGTKSDMGQSSAVHGIEVTVTAAT